MQLNTNEDIEAPIDFVFERITDFEGFERAALRRGAELMRRDAGAIDVGSIWDLHFRLRGKEREATIEVTQFDDPQFLGAHISIGGVLSEGSVELIQLNQKRTRMRVSSKSAPKTFAARLLLQSAKLAKGRIDKRFKSRVNDFASEIEDDFKSGAL